MKSLFRNPRLIVIFKLTVLLVTAAFANETQSTCARVSWFLFNRHLSASYLDSANALLALVRQENPYCEDALYLLTRIHLQKGDLAQTKDEKITSYERARATAETLKAINPLNPEGWLWSAVAQGRIGQVRGLLNSLFLVPNIKKSFYHALELDSTHATAYHALGRLYYELPEFMGGNLGKSEEYLLQALKFDPNYTAARLALAKIYVKQESWDKAREQLKMVLATPTPTYPADFFLEEKPEALKLLQEIKHR